MTKKDVTRHLEWEVPDIGVLANQPSQLVCFNDECESKIEVDPDTYVVEDEDAVEIHPQMGLDTSRRRIEIYCSPECRNKRYS